MRHPDLLRRPLVAALTTVLPSGAPQSQPVWFTYEPPQVLINTMRGFRKELNLRRDPRATLLLVDPDDPGRWLEVRGLVELDENGARAHLDRLAQLYAGVDTFFGGCVPAELAEREVPVIGRLSVLRALAETSADDDPAGPAQPLAPAPAVELPASHRDLLERPLAAALATLLPAGPPRTRPARYSFDGRSLLLDTGGLRAGLDPRAALLVIDPADSARWIEVRGLVDGGRLVPQHVVCDAIHRPLHVPVSA